MYLTRRLSAVLLALLSVLMVHSKALADTVTFSDTVALSRTNWVGKSVTLPKFDPSLGKLTGVEWTLDGRIVNNAFGENTGPSPATITLTNRGTITLRRPDLTVLTSVTPILVLAATGITLPGFDGTLDFGGASGYNLQNVEATGSASGSAPPPTSDLALFTGPGTITLPLNAVGQSTASGAGNFAFGFITNAEAKVTVKYTYIPFVSISGKVWNELVDVNAVGQNGEPGVPNVTITLLGDTDGDGVNDTVQTATLTTMDILNGTYSFTKLLPGNYSVTMTTPAGYFVTPGTSTVLNVAAVVPGTNYGNNDFFVYTPTGSIGDTVYYDINKNGSQDANEPGIAGVKVTLTDENGNSAVAFTGSAGNYLFSGLPAGNFQVTVDPSTLPAGLTLQTVDRDSALPGGALDNTTIVALPANKDILDADFGYTGIGSIGDRVWYDKNGDTVQDASEVGLPSVGVKLTWAGFDNTFGTVDDIVLETTTTVENAMTNTAAGLYLFPNLPAGKYRVETAAGTIPTGFVQTYDLDGINTPNKADNIDLAAGQNKLDVDFGYQWRLGSISGITFVDSNGNGNLDPGELPIPGVVVTLSNGQTATTGTDGSYIFNNLPEGSYTVTAPTSAAGKALTSTNPQGATITIQNPNVTDRNFGYKPGTISGYAYLDKNGNSIFDNGDTPIAGAVIELNPGGVTATTNNSGFYEFTNLDAGTYTVSAPDVAGDANISTAQDLSVELPVGGNKPNNNFGYVVGSIGDRVWLDANGNGLQDNNEAGITGVTVRLFNGSNLVDTQVTGTNGTYKFSDLLAGDYRVEVVASTLPSGYIQTFDLDGIGTLNTANATLGVGQNRIDVDFGYKAPTTPSTGKICGTVFCDENCNNRLDCWEDGIGGVTVTIRFPDGTTKTAVTNACGDYCFTGLPAGTYVLSVPSTIPGACISSTNPITIVLGSGQARCDVDFAYDCINFTTYTQGGWGSNPSGNNPGALLKKWFTKVYPNGVVIGKSYTIKLTSSNAVNCFLPQGGSPARLTRNYCNTTSRLGVFAGQVLALKLNVDFSKACITSPGLATLKLKSGKLCGKTVQYVLDLANCVLGGANPPSGISISDLNNICDAINNNFDNGNDRGYLGR